jgi:hypothetical protein
MNSSMEVEDEEDGDGYDYDNLLGDDADEQRLLRQRRQQGGGASTDGAGNLPIVTPYVPRRMVNARLPRGNKAMSLAAIDDQKVLSPTTLNPATAICDETYTQGPSGHGDLDAWIEKLYRCEPLAEGDVIALCHKAKEILLQEPSVKHIPCPVSVCGDIHGQVGGGRLRAPCVPSHPYPCPLEFSSKTWASCSGSAAEFPTRATSSSVTSSTGATTRWRRSSS